MSKTPLTPPARFLVKLRANHQKLAVALTFEVEAFQLLAQDLHFGKRILGLHSLFLHLSHDGQLFVHVVDDWRVRVPVLVELGRERSQDVGCNI